jgi:Flp pilus assembly protein TadG
MSRKLIWKRRGYRSQRGALGTLLFLFGIFILLLFAIIAIDISHFVSANAELQSAADAAALMGVYNLQWNSTGANTAAADADARFMAQNSFADRYSPGGLNIPSGSVSVSFSSLNGGTNNAVTVRINPPMLNMFAPFIGNLSTLVGVSATAEQLPIQTAPAPPWFLNTSAQGGPTSPAPLPSPAPAPPTTFPANAYVTFADSSSNHGNAHKAPPILPTYWVDMGISDLSNANPNPVGVKKVLQCRGYCDSGSCNTVNPIVINGSQINANHGSYNSANSRPWASDNQALWTNGDVVVLPVTTGSDPSPVTSIYLVKLTGPFVPNSWQNGQGVFGEMQIQFVGHAENIAGVVAMDPTTGSNFTNVGATVGVLVK